MKGIDPETGHHFDDTRRYVDQVKGLSDSDRYKIFEGNARRVYPRLDALLTRRVSSRDNTKKGTAMGSLLDRDKGSAAR